MSKLSIVIPIYNMEKYIEDSLDKILNQTLKEFEVILINDGSNDNSGKICDRYAIKDSRIKVIHKKNEGAGPARNKGIEVSTGKYIMFIDIDDVVEDTMFEVMYNQIENNNVDLVICNHNAFGEDLNIKNCKDISKEYEVRGIDNCRRSYIGLLKKGMNQPPWDKIYKSEIIKENNLKFPNTRRCQDALFNCRYFEYVENYKVIKDSLYNYRVNDTRTSWSKFPKEFFDICIILDKTYTDTLKRWNLLNEEASIYLATYFINEIIQCIRFAFSPKWEFSYKERKNYISNIVNNERTEQAVKLYDSTATTYKKVMLNLILSKKVNAIMSITKIDLFMRINMKNTFELLKAKFN